VGVFIRGGNLFRIGLTLGWQDVKQSYRRSALGQLWITIGMAVMIAAIGLVFGLIFGSPIQVFLPYLASGIIMWGLIAGILNDGTSAFISAEGMIKQLPLPKLAHLVRVIWRNLITTAHNIVIYPIVVLIVGGNMGWAILLWPLGVVIAVVSVSGLALILSVFATRYRDVPPIVNSVVTVGFYVTPVIWQADGLGDSALAHLLLGFNPFYHLLQISRMPLLGQFPTLPNWGLALLSAGIFWLIGLLVYKKYENRIAYWV
jgi:ABC-type polysaccharide/polyol phosphate export permease